MLEANALTPPGASWSVGLHLNSPITQTATLREYLLNKSYTAYQQPDTVLLDYRHLKGRQPPMTSSPPMPEMAASAWPPENRSSSIMASLMKPENRERPPSAGTRSASGMNILLSSTVASSDDFNIPASFQSRSIVMEANALEGNDDSDETAPSRTQFYDNLLAISGEAMPAFDFGMPRNITARTGHTEAIIKCRVDKLDDKSVRLKVNGLFPHFPIPPMFICTCISLTLHCSTLHYTVLLCSTLLYTALLYICLFMTI